jgi:ribosome-binding protein aMBF1 (putative translation factor)
MDQRGMGVVDLSYQTNVSPITVKRWLNGCFEPRHKNLSKIAHALHVSADYLHDVGK